VKGPRQPAAPKKKKSLDRAAKSKWRRGRWKRGLLLEGRSHKTRVELCPVDGKPAPSDRKGEPARGWSLREGTHPHRQGPGRGGSRHASSLQKLRDWKRRPCNLGGRGHALCGGQRSRPTGRRKKKKGGADFHARGRARRKERARGGTPRKGGGGNRLRDCSGGKKGQLPWGKTPLPSQSSGKEAGPRPADERRDSCGCTYKKEGVGLFTERKRKAPR